MQNTQDHLSHKPFPAGYPGSAYLSPAYISPATCAELIFPTLSSIPRKLVQHRERSDVLKEIHDSQQLSEAFHRMPDEMQQAFVDFCMGNRGLQITYDPFFKSIFDHNRHPGRLDMLLSDLLGQEVTVVSVEDLKRSLPSAESSLIFLDILVRLKDGSLVDVEIQKIGLKFPVERAFCYGSDMIMRQYDILKEAFAQDFSYEKMRPVYVIVFIEESSGPFHRTPDHYIHRSKMVFDTELELNDLIKFIFIPLDIFRKSMHNENRKEEHHTDTSTPLTRLDAWLYFLSSDHPEDMERIIRAYPFFNDIYRDIMSFQYDVNELMYMVPEALQIMDNNTIKMMVEERKEKIAKQEKQIQAQEKKIQNQEETIQTQEVKIQTQKEKIQTLEEKNLTLEQQNAALLAELEALKSRK